MADKITPLTPVQKRNLKGRAGLSKNDRASFDHEVANFAQEPITVSALRAHKTANAEHWTPRDALLDVLRRLDKGEIKPDALIVVWRQIDPKGGGVLDFSVSSDSGVTTLGLLARAAYRVNTNMDPD